MQKNRDSGPISGFTACCQRCDRQVLYTQVRRTVASYQEFFSFELPSDQLAKRVMKFESKVNTV